MTVLCVGSDMRGMLCCMMAVLCVGSDMRGTLCCVMTVLCVDSDMRGTLCCMMAVLCVGSDMRGTLRCIQNNVRKRCGEEASQLAATLVKPMVRQSTKCDYSIVTKAVRLLPVIAVCQSREGVKGRRGRGEIDEGSRRTGRHPGQTERAPSAARGSSSVVAVAFYPRVCVWEGGGAERYGRWVRDKMKEMSPED